MSASKKRREKEMAARVEDFRRRVACDSSAVLELGKLGRILAVNPMSDEQSVLERLEIGPESCTKVDLYWEFAADVAFVQVQSKHYANPRQVGAYVRRTFDGWLNLVIVVSDPSISSTCVIGALTDVSEAIAALNYEDIGPNLVALDQYRAR